MPNGRIEELLEELVHLNSEILGEMVAMRTEVETLHNTVCEELNWAKEHSFAEAVVDRMNEISTRLNSIETALND